MQPDLSNAHVGNLSCKDAGSQRRIPQPKVKAFPQSQIDWLRGSRGMMCAGVIVIVASRRCLAAERATALEALEKSAGQKHKTLPRKKTLDALEDHVGESQTRHRRADGSA